MKIQINWKILQNMHQLSIAKTKNVQKLWVTTTKITIKPTRTIPDNWLPGTAESEPGIPLYPSNHRFSYKILLHKIMQKCRCKNSYSKITGNILYNFIPTSNNPWQRNPLPKWTYERIHKHPRNQSTSLTVIHASV